LDTVLSILKHTAFNPLNTLPLYLAGLYTARGREYVAKHPRVFRWLKVLLGFGLWQRISSFLDAGVANNWTNDTYDWGKELVVVTGGSDGIGAAIVKLLAELGIKVVILDIQEPKYVGT
jgi:all-trans-retinol dehydrogenase (NAD+)